MDIKINVPDIGSDEVEVTELLVKKGDQIKLDQPLLIVEGDKVSMEIPSPHTGIVKDIKISIGSKISTGSLIMIFEKDNNDLLETVSENKLINSRLEIKNEKQAFNLNSDLLKPKDNFKEKDNVYTSPIVRRIAREFNINLTKVKGTGRKGRILREDVQEYIKKSIKFHEINLLKNYDQSESVNKLLSWPKIDFSKFGRIEEVELDRIQKISGANLSRNWKTIPHVTHFDKVDITNLEEFRRQQNTENNKFKLNNIKITIVVFAMKAVAFALKQMPRFNSSLSEDGQFLTLKNYINISIAVDTPNGLIVPVFKEVDKKNIFELSKELIIVSKKARDGKLNSDEIKGGCFTISSIGSLGTTYFTPIVNAPEVAILGISKSSIQPIWNGKEFVPRLILPISLSFDHRVIDGADGARFINIINKTLSDIRYLLI